MNFDLPHRRLNVLTGEWVLVSPHRATRPWLGQVEKVPLENLPPYDPTCYLCPGNMRAADRRNPHYTSTYVFDNDFPALLSPDQLAGSVLERATGDDLIAYTPLHSPSLFNSQPEVGICRVVCFSPRHDLSLPQMAQSQVEAVAMTWIEQTIELGRLDFTEYIQVFENKGSMMGASNPHPHSQIWATGHLPSEPAKELQRQKGYLSQAGSCLLCDYLDEEMKHGERMILENEHFAALVPYWAVWPYETLIIARRHSSSLVELNSAEIGNLANILREITTRYDNLFQISFPYSMGFHQAPVDGRVYPEWHLHAHYYPPLLRSATIRKFMVGYEMMAEAQRDLTPETAAERLRSTSGRHYRLP